MQPEYPQPGFQQPAIPPLPEPPQHTSRKKLIIIGAVVLLVIAAIATYFLVIKKSGNKTEDHVKNTGSTVIFGSSATPVSYADNKMYDACNLIPVSLLKTHIEKYDETFNSMSSDQRLKSPLMIDHGYVDRTIPNILGTDSTARDPGTTVSETGIDSTVRAKSFISVMDSHCIYGQGSSFNTEFAAAYILQPPAPLHPKLTAYLAELKQKGKMATESQGVEVYIEPVQESDETYTAIFKKRDTVVFFTSLQQKLIQAASDEIVKVLAKEPAGPSTITYPPFYSKLTDTCKLFPASDFERLLGKPASAVATETWAITESEEDTAMRECSRIEVERFKQGEISSTVVGLSESRTEDQTKKRLTAITTDERNTAAPVKNLGDEAYVITRDATAHLQYSLVIRSGKVLLTIESSGETKDANADAFLSRTLPVGQTVFSNYTN